MADNVKEVIKTPPPSQTNTDDNRRRTRSQTRNGGMTPPAPVLESRGRKRASQSQPGSGGKRGRKPAQPKAPAEEHSIKPENQDLPKNEEVKEGSVENQKNDNDVEMKPAEGDARTTSADKPDVTHSEPTNATKKEDVSQKKNEEPISVQHQNNDDAARASESIQNKEAQKEENKQQMDDDVQGKEQPQLEQPHTDEQSQEDKQPDTDERPKEGLSSENERVEQTNEGNKHEKDGEAPSNTIDLSETKRELENDNQSITNDKLSREDNTTDDAQEVDQKGLVEGSESKVAGEEPVQRDEKEHATDDKKIVDSSQDKPQVIST